MTDDRWRTWLAEVAELLNIEPEEVLASFYQTRELLFETGASPREAADFLRLYG